MPSISTVSNIIVKATIPLCSLLLNTRSTKTRPSIFLVSINSLTKRVCPPLLAQWSFVHEVPSMKPNDEPHIPTELPPITTTPEINPGKHEDDQVPFEPDPMPMPGPDFPETPSQPPMGPDIPLPKPGVPPPMTPPEVVPPPGPDILPPRPPGPEIPPPPDIKPPPMGPTIVF